MLTVYFGDADKDKDRFIFDSIASVMPSDVFLLVPDQFTLQAERNAFQYMNADALLELEIVSRSGFTPVSYTHLQQQRLAERKK